MNIIIVTQIIMWLIIGWSAISLYFFTRYITLDKHLPYLIPTIIIIYSTALQIPSLEAPLFAQREHIFVLLFLPFLLIRINQWEQDSQNSGMWYRFIYGTIAAIGVSIKPYFAIIPILTELYGISIHRDWKRLRRSEIYGFGLFACLHVLYFIIFPDIRTGLVELLTLAQDGYSSYIRINHSLPFLNWLVYDDIRNTFFILMVIWLIRSPNDKVDLIIRTICIFVFGGILIFSMQVGFRYHMIVFQIGT